MEGFKFRCDEDYPDRFKLDDAVDKTTVFFQQFDLDNLTKEGAVATGVDPVSGKLVRRVWDERRAQDLTWTCDSSAEDYRGRLEAVFAEWSSACNVKFHYVPATSAPLFTVKYAGDKGNVLAEAFFPGASKYTRFIKLYKGYVDLDGNDKAQHSVLLHEVGHVLGLRHEHIRLPDNFGEAQTVRDGNGILGAEYFGPPDKDSVMDYTKVQGDLRAGRQSALSKDDIATVQALYGTAFKDESDRKRPNPGTGEYDPSAAVASTRKDLDRRAPGGRALKVALLKADEFAYFRGTSPQFFRELMAALYGKDAEFKDLVSSSPVVALCGDGHSENCGAKKNKTTKEMSLVLTDVDDASQGCAAIDIVRALASLVPLLQSYGNLAANTEAMSSWLDGYVEGVQGVVTDVSHCSNLLSKMLKKAADQKTKDRLNDTKTELKELRDGQTRVTEKPEGQNLAAAIAAALGVAASKVTDVVRDSIGTASSDLIGYRTVVDQD